MAERDRTALLHSILAAGKRFTASDAVWLILAERGEDGRQRLRLSLWQCDTLPDLSPAPDILRLIDDESIIGHAAATKEVLVVSARKLGHHEKLDGTGYPRCLRCADIPIQTRLMTIADMFDALTESDRPYKAAVSPEAALGILNDEARAGRLDENLVQLLVETQAYRKILDEDWRKFWGRAERRTTNGKFLPRVAVVPQGRRTVLEMIR
ncbi:MAG: HD-GYP domain-containing protein [Gemmatimonadaceae bacterium]